MACEVKHRRGQARGWVWKTREGKKRLSCCRWKEYARSGPDLSHPLPTTFTTPTNTIQRQPGTPCHSISLKSSLCRTGATHLGEDAVWGGNDGMAVADGESFDSQLRGATKLTSPATEQRAPNAHPSYTVPSWRTSFAPRRAPGPVPTAGAAFFSCGECMTRMCQASLTCVCVEGTHSSHAESSESGLTWLNGRNAKSFVHVTVWRRTFCFFEEPRKIMDVRAQRSCTHMWSAPIV